MRTSPALSWSDDHEQADDTASDRIVDDAFRLNRSEASAGDRCFSGRINVAVSQWPRKLSLVIVPANSLSRLSNERSIFLFALS